MTATVPWPCQDYGPIRGASGRSGTSVRARWKPPANGGRRFASRRSWLDPRDLLVRMTSAGDEGEGVRAATIRTAPRPQALGNHRTRTRIVSMVWLVSGALWSLLEMLGHDQPRDSHVHGAPHARAEPSAQLMQYERGVCARRTATKYRNTTTATRHPAGLRAALACSVANMVAVAGSSGRRGRRFKSCHPDQCFRR